MTKLPLQTTALVAGLFYGLAAVVGLLGIAAWQVHLPARGLKDPQDLKAARI